KEQAQAVVNDLPAGDEQNGYQARLEALTDLAAPAVTDKDSDGQLDTQEYAAAEEAVKKAEEAHKKAEEAIAKYPAGSVVTPDEQKAVQDLID
ncbi:GA-like domain-containing protein, partial [Streptococcus suis]